MSLQVENLSFAYYSGRPVLCELNLEVKAGQVTGLFGPNGSGKSTLLRCLNGALRPQTGWVRLEGQRLDTFSPREIARRIAVVPQDTPPQVPFLVREMVMLGRFAHWGVWGIESPEDQRVVRDCLERIGALDLMNRPFSELSGGERQRVIIARALAQETRILLMDEPASHLDIAHQLEVFQLGRGLAAEGYTVLMVCHDLVVAPLFVDYAVLLKQGRLFARGTVPETLRSENLAECYGAALTLSWPSPHAASISLNQGTVAAQRACF